MSKITYEFETGEPIQYPKTVFDNAIWGESQLREAFIQGYEYGVANNITRTATGEWPVQTTAEIVLKNGNQAPLGTKMVIRVRDGELQTFYFSD